MNKNSKTAMESLHFIIEGKFLQNHSRQLFWFEDREKLALRMLSEGLVGIKDEQVKKIINGDDEHHIDKNKIFEFIKEYTKLVKYETSDPLYVDVQEKEVVT